MKCSDFISRLNEINQIFKGIYNSLDKFQNTWNVQDGRFIMHHENQFPSFIELKYDTSMMYNAKGIRTTKGLMYDEFITNITSVDISINSIQFFDYLKGITKTDIEIIEMETNKILIEGEDITVPFTKDKILFNNTTNLISRFVLDDESVNKIMELKNVPFEMVFDFDNEKVGINLDTSELESFLNVKTSSKFLPYLVECCDTKGCNVEIEVHSTDVDYMYDIVFNVEQYKINAKGVKTKNPIEVKYGIRILEL